MQRQDEKGCACNVATCLRRGTHALVSFEQGPCELGDGSCHGETTPSQRIRSCREIEKVRFAKTLGLGVARTRGIIVSWILDAILPR